MSGAASTTWLAPAKLNLFLHVVGRRDDGYHLIQSAMRLIDLVDTLTIAVRDDGRIERTTELPGVPPESDLAVRAARLLQSASGTAAGASIGVEKRIPQGGGLGGGSSDAATTLLALNRLWQLGWSRQRLAALGLALGADVPFFVGGGDAWVEGIGERLVPIALDDAYYAIVHPGVAVPTAAIFGAVELTRDSPPLKISDFARETRDLRGARAQNQAQDRMGSFRNDLEPVAVARFDAVRDALSWLERREDGVDRPGARGPARMSGSGACVFRPFASVADAAACLVGLPAGWSGWSVPSLAVHPHRDCAPD